MSFDDILVPTLLLDERRCRANIDRMAEKARRHGLHFRPHMKTHQSRRVGSWLRESGVTAITVSSLRMAEYFADDGWDDITVAFPVNLRETARIDELAGRIRLQLLVESPHALRRLQDALRQPVDVLIKIDAGYGRTGIAYDDDEAVDAMLDAIDQAPLLTLRGILTHGGDSYQARSPEEIVRSFARTRDRMLHCATRVRERFPAAIISVGDTPGCSLAVDFSGIDEIRPGNFVYYDVMQARLGACATGDIAVALAAPVVSLHEQRREAVVYAGAVQLSKEVLTGGDGRQSYGDVVLLTDDGWSPPLPDTRVARVSQEHGIIETTSEIIELLREGALIAILPVHSCLTAECMRGYTLLDGSTADHLAGMAHPTSIT